MLLQRPMSNGKEGSPPPPLNERWLIRLCLLRCWPARRAAPKPERRLSRGRGERSEPPLSRLRQCV